MCLLMGEVYEESITFESHKASCQQHSDVIIMHKMHSVGSAIGILVATLHNSSCHSPSHQVAPILQ